MLNKQGHVTVENSLGMRSEYLAIYVTQGLQSDLQLGPFDTLPTAKLAVCYNYRHL